MGLARFFRAFFYFEKVKRFGDVPWINKPLNIDDPELTKACDSSTLVMDSVLADIDFATQNIRTTTDTSRSLITKWVAHAFKARVCLFEGTFRKYHTNLNLSSIANTWLTHASTAAKEIIDKAGFKLYEGAGAALSYRTVFTSVIPVQDEVMLVAIADPSN